MSGTAKTQERQKKENADFAAAVRKGIAEANAGKGIPYDKIRRWLLSWGTDKELPPPK
jgi:predicted transcriptional regulator